MDSIGKPLFPSVHLRRRDVLELVATLNLPPPVLNTVRVISDGGRLTGITFTTRAPVRSGELQEDGGNMWAAHVLGVLDAVGEVRSVLGITFLREGVLSAELTRSLMAAVALPSGTP